MRIKPSAAEVYLLDTRTLQVSNEVWTPLCMKGVFSFVSQCEIASLVRNVSEISNDRLSSFSLNVILQSLSSN